MRIKEIALETMYCLASASKEITLAYWMQGEADRKFHFNAAVADVREAMARLGIVEATSPEFVKFQEQARLAEKFRSSINPHISEYRMDDERPYTACPHCGYDDCYDPEYRCAACGLWAEDEPEAKLFRLKELANGLDENGLNKLFELLIMEVVE